MNEVFGTDSFKYRAKLRGFNLKNVEEILRYSTGRYYDTVTEGLVVVGKDASVMVVIPYENHEESAITPITRHATNRQQIRYRVKSGRYRNE